MRCTRVTQDNRRCVRYAAWTQHDKGWCWQHWRNRSEDERHVVQTLEPPNPIRTQGHLSLVVDNAIDPELPNAS